MLNPCRPEQVGVDGDRSTLCPERLGHRSANIAYVSERRRFLELMHEALKGLTPEEVAIGNTI